MSNCLKKHKIVEVVDFFAVLIINGLFINSFRLSYEDIFRLDVVASELMQKLFLPPGFAGSLMHAVVRLGWLMLPDLVSFLRDSTNVKVFSCERAPFPTNTNTLRSVSTT